jgi:hypothetical protein
LRRKSTKAAEFPPDSAAFFAGKNLENEKMRQDLRRGRGDVFGGFRQVDKEKTGGFK